MVCQPVFSNFTTNMLVALFFAVEGKNPHEPPSAVWCIEVPNRKMVWEVREDEKAGSELIGPFEFADKGPDPPIATFLDTAYVPEHIDERVRAQGSVFMIEPRGKKEEWTLHTKLMDKSEVPIAGTNQKKPTKTLKVLIPLEFRKTLLKQLDRIGVNRANLFPDLASAARYLEWAIHQGNRN